MEGDDEDSDPIHNASRVSLTTAATQMSSTDKISNTTNTDNMKRSFATEQVSSSAPPSPSNVSESTEASLDDSDTWPSDPNMVASYPAAKKRASPIPLLTKSDLTSSTNTAGSNESNVSFAPSMAASSSIRRPQRLSSSSQSIGSSRDRASFCDEISRSFSNEQEDIEEEHDDASSCASDTLLESSNWRVQPSSIKQVPLIYPLSSSSGFVENCSSLKVSARISHCLTTRSIAAMYDDNRGTAMATTDEGLGFAIRLFHGSGSYSTGIIVEVQHQQGDALQFHNVCQMIFEAAKGRPYSRRSKHAAEQVRAPPATLLKGRHYDDQHDQMQNSLEKANELLEKDRIDAKKLGMEMLIFLTNPVQEDTAQQDEHTLFAAETIILARDSIGQSLHEKLLSLLHKPHPTGIYSNGKYAGDSSDEEEEFDEQDEVELLRPGALKVVRNSLSVLSKATDIREVVSDKTVPEWLVESLVPALVTEVKSARLYPGDGYVAAECLIALFELSDKAKSKALELEATPLLETAHDYGTQYHALLGRATQVCLTELNNYMSLKTEHD